MLGNNLFEICINLINKWIPKEKYSNELQYRDDLMNFLHESLNNPRNRQHILIQKEDGRSLCDIGIGNKQVGIELKKDLKTKDQRDRLFGQLDDFKDEYHEGVIIVLVGSTDTFALNKLRVKIRGMINKRSITFSPFKIFIIDKDSEKTSNSIPSPKKFSWDRYWSG